MWGYRRFRIFFFAIKTEKRITRGGILIRRIVGSTGRVLAWNSVSFYESRKTSWTTLVGLKFRGFLLILKKCARHWKDLVRLFAPVCAPFCEIIGQHWFPRLSQGCQLGQNYTKPLKFGIFWKSLDRKFQFGQFLAIRDILEKFGTMGIGRIFSRGRRTQFLHIIKLNVEIA